MNPRSRSLPLSGLRAVHNARTRIYAAGSDPLLARAAPRRTFRLVPAFPDDARTPKDDPRLWRPEMLDRLEPPLTRYRE